MTEPDPRAPMPPETEPESIALSGHIGPDEAPSLCDCVQARASASENDPICYDVAAVEAPDVGTVDALARMALTARRLGRRIELRRTRPDLGELLELAGLAGSAVEVIGEAEEREEPLGVEEERDPGDAVL